MDLYLTITSVGTVRTDVDGAVINTPVVLTRGTAGALSIHLPNTDIATRTWAVEFAAERAADTALLAFSAETSGGTIRADLGACDSESLAAAIGFADYLRGVLVVSGIPLGRDIPDVVAITTCVILNRPGMDTPPPTDPARYYTRQQVDAKFFATLSAIESAGIAAATSAYSEVISGVIASAVNLDAAVLSGAVASAASLDSAVLSGAIASAVELNVVVLSRAVASAASLDSAVLSGAIASAAELDVAALSGAVASAASLDSAVLSGAVASAASLDSASFSSVIAVAAAFDAVVLSGAVTAAAALDAAVLSDAVASAASLDSAVLSDAVASAAELALPVTSVSDDTSAYIPVLAGGAHYSYTRPLVALNIGTVEEATRESVIVFSAGATSEGDIVTPCTVTLPSIVRLLGSSSVVVESGGVYELNFWRAILAMARVYDQSDGDES